jgi:NAD(P) transhydrogenase
MMSSAHDVLVIGGGPAGQKAAICAAKLGKDVLLVEQSGSLPPPLSVDAHVRAHIGGECVRRGTIPSKTLREAALALSAARRRCGASVEISSPFDVPLVCLMDRVERVVQSHERFMGAQLERNGVRVRCGRARFVDSRTVEIEGIDGAVELARADVVVIATGSRPRAPRDIPIDHENVLDSDSILSLTYLPRTLTVLGAGVIACEYASVFQALGTRVVVVDPSPRPLPFLDPEISDRFLAGFVRAGGRYVGSNAVASVVWDGVSQIVTTLANGTVLESDKLLCARGRVANVDGLDLERAGLSLNARGVLDVDAHLRTKVAHVYAVGDVAGPPSLASAAMDQGRRAVCHAFGVEPGPPPETTPSGIYTLPEIASVGLTEADAVARYGSAIVGRASFDEVARGQIMGLEDGLLKLVSDPAGRRVLGVHIVGEGAAELVHLGQMAIVSGLSVDAFVHNVFNFPTLAEAYRVAALDIANKRAARSHLPPPVLATPLLPTPIAKSA